LIQSLLKCNEKIFKVEIFDSIINLILSIKSNLKEIDFSIDVKHELAKFIYENNESIKLTRNEFFCNDKNFDKNKICSTWYNWSTPNCQHQILKKEIGNHNVFFGVKTFQDYHTERCKLRNLN
jgi:hypothetical protein